MGEARHEGVDRGLHCVCAVCGFMFRLVSAHTHQRSHFPLLTSGLTFCLYAHPPTLTFPSLLPWILGTPSQGDGDYEICNDFIIDDWLRMKIAASEEELVKEKDCVSHLIGRMGGSCALRGAEDTTVSVNLRPLLPGREVGAVIGEDRPSAPLHPSGGVIDAGASNKICEVWSLIV